MAFEPFFELVRLGILDVILPFVLVFTLVYALFSKTQIFGRQTNRTAVIFALFAAFIFVGLFSFENFMWTLLWMVLIFFVFLMYILLVKFVGIDTKVNNFVILLVFIVFAIIASYNYIDINRFISFVFNPVVITILVFAAILWFILHDSGKEEGGKKEKSETGKESEAKSAKPKESESAAKEAGKEPQYSSHDIPKYRWEEVERIPGDKFESEYEKKWPPAGGKF